jgi:1-acyl-sn-glycerol-3-phosphate acyltransferase
MAQKRGGSVLRAAAVLLLLAFNTFVWGSLVTLTTLVKLIIPRGTLRRRVAMAVSSLVDRWSSGNRAVIHSCLDTRWEDHGIDGLRRDGRYLVISNHQSWIDIFVLFDMLLGKAQFPRFFIKQQLIWFPIIGQATWLLDFPFMKRYTPEYLEKHPEKRGEDLETTRRTCQRFRKIPVTILNFLEGTRFSKDKQAEQESPYRHLLRPRIGGIGYVLASIGDQLDALLDVTLVYPGNEIRLWEFISNQIERVEVHARRVPIPPEFLTSAVTEEGPVRDRFKEWMNAIWREKDELLEEKLG